MTTQHTDDLRRDCRLFRRLCSGNRQEGLGELMATEQTLIKELIRAKMINAKREKEAVILPKTPVTADPLYQHWEG